MIGLRCMCSKTRSTEAAGLPSVSIFFRSWLKRFRISREADQRYSKPGVIQATLSGINSAFVHYPGGRVVFPSGIRAGACV
jgi:hypothetical protein